MLDFPAVCRAFWPIVNCLLPVDVQQTSAYSTNVAGVALEHEQWRLVGRPDVEELDVGVTGGGLSGRKKWFSFLWQR